jgi:hypothetical protein
MAVFLWRPRSSFFIIPSRYFWQLHPNLKSAFAFFPCLHLPVANDLIFLGWLQVTREVL